MTAAKAKRYVIDASVALKWYLPEDDSNQALKWYHAIKKGSLFALSLDYLFFECANAALKRHKVKPDDTSAMINDLESLGLELIPISTLRIDNVMSLADRYNLTIYDAMYLELARFTQVKLVTTDMALLRIKKYTRPI